MIGSNFTRFDEIGEYGRSVAAVRPGLRELGGKERRQNIWESLCWTISLEKTIHLDLSNYII